MLHRVWTRVRKHACSALFWYVGEPDVGDVFVKIESIVMFQHPSIMCSLCRIPLRLRLAGFDLQAWFNLFDWPVPSSSEPKKNKQKRTSTRPKLPRKTAPSPRPNTNTFRDETGSRSAAAACLMLLSEPQIKHQQKRTCRRPKLPRKELPRYFIFRAPPAGGGVGGYNL